MVGTPLKDREEDVGPRVPGQGFGPDPVVGGVALACLLSLAARRERLSSCTKTSLLPSSLPRVNFSTEIALALEPAPFLVCGREFRGTQCLAQLLLLLGR